MRSALAPFAALILAAGSLASPAVAQPPEPSPSPAPLSGPTASHPDAPAPPVQAVRLDAPVNVDGVLDEAVWHDAPPAVLFHQKDPVEWAPPSQRTEVRVAYDDDAIYIAAHCFDTAPDSVIARLTRRDLLVPSDMFLVYLDPNRDRRSGYYFGVNAAGALFDGTLSNDGNDDDSWDGVWTGRVRRTTDGWVAEMRIPLSQLRYAAGPAPEWGIDFERDIQRNNEKDMIVHQPKNGQGFCSRFPPLTGLRNLRTTRAVEILPYVTSKGEFIGHPIGDPFNDGSRMSSDVGGDLRMSVGSRLTLNATVNPDFGQVEVDPAVVNLSASETYFNEKRPFFVEGSSNFRFGNEGANSYWNFNWPEPQFFYSRRIGRGPEISAPDSQFTNVPIGTTILGAAKLTGKLGSSWNFGTLHAITNREEADFAGSVDHNKREAGVEPLTYYGIARGLHEFKDRRFGLGLLGSAVLRNLDAPQFASQLNRQAFVTGVDGWAFLDRKKMWVISGYSAMSQLRGTKDDILAVQQNYRHYYQRPDAAEVHLDPNATSLTGAVTRLWLNKQQGNVYSNAGLGFVTPGFDVNDLGFGRGSDVINGHWALGRKWTKPNSIYKQQNLHGALFGSWDFDGVRTWGGGFLEEYTQFRNNWFLDFETAYNPQSQNDHVTRGGPRIQNPAGTEFSLSANTDSKRPLSYTLSGYFYNQPSGDEYYWNIYPGVEVKPTSSLDVTVGPGYERTKDSAAFVDIIADPLAVDTYGNRYLFADNHQTTLSANIRLNWAFSPRVSLQFYGQPYFTTAAYDNYKELARGGTYDFNVFGQGGSSTAQWDAANNQWIVDPDGAGPAAPITISNRSFNYRSMRGNAVFRWEYMPGSAIYLVWTQLRQDQEGISDFALRRSASHLFDAHPDNIFLAKVTYYFTP